MERQEQDLRVCILAENLANEGANAASVILHAALDGLLGEKILKQSGQMLAKHLKLMPDLGQFKIDEKRGPFWFSLHVYRHMTDYSLAWTAKACVNGRHPDMVDEKWGAPDYSSTCYRESTVYIGDMGGEGRQYLIKLTDPCDDRRTDYDYDQVKALRVAADVAKKASDDAVHACFPFRER